MKHLIQTIYLVAMFETQLKTHNYWAGVLCRMSSNFTLDLQQFSVSIYLATNNVI